jgi:hypothetical protein
MAVLDDLLEQALALPDADRGVLAIALFRSLEPDGDEVGTVEWQTAWSKEIDRRAIEVQQGHAELVDGDQVMTEARAIVSAPKSR